MVWLSYADTCSYRRWGSWPWWPGGGRRFELGFLLLPVLYVFGIHALTTHFIPRYAYPVVPLLVLVFSIAVHEVYCAPKARGTNSCG